MMTMPISVLCIANLLQSGSKDALISLFWATAYTMLCFTGETEMTFSFCMSSVLMIAVLVVSVAVAVNAIALTFTGMMLLNSPK